MGRVTVLLTGVPKYATLDDLSYYLDCLFDTNPEVGKFDVRELPRYESKRQIALDFCSGFDAIAAQEQLDGYRYQMEDGQKHTFWAKITNRKDYLRRESSLARSRSPIIAGESWSTLACLPTMSDSAMFRANAKLDAKYRLLRKQKLIVQTERELLRETRQLKKDLLDLQGEPSTSRRSRAPAADQRSWSEELELLRFKINETSRLKELQSVDWQSNESASKSKQWSPLLEVKKENQMSQSLDKSKSQNLSAWERGLRDNGSGSRISPRRSLRAQSRSPTPNSESIELGIREYRSRSKVRSRCDSLITQTPSHTRPSTSRERGLLEYYRSRSKDRSRWDSSRSLELESREKLCYMVKKSRSPTPSSTCKFKSREWDPRPRTPTPTTERPCSWERTSSDERSKPREPEFMDERSRIRQRNFGIKSSLKRDASSRKSRSHKLVSRDERSRSRERGSRNKRSKSRDLVIWDFNPKSQQCQTSNVRSSAHPFEVDKTTLKKTANGDTYSQKDTVTELHAGCTFKLDDFFHLPSYTNNRTRPTDVIRNNCTITSKNAEAVTAGIEINCVTNTNESTNNLIYPKDTNVNREPTIKLNDKNNTLDNRRDEENLNENIMKDKEENTDKSIGAENREAAINKDRIIQSVVNDVMFRMQTLFLEISIKDNIALSYSNGKLMVSKLNVLIEERVKSLSADENFSELTAFENYRRLYTKEDETQLLKNMLDELISSKKIDNTRNEKNLPTEPSRNASAEVEITDTQTCSPKVFWNNEELDKPSENNKPIPACPQFVLVIKKLMKQLKPVISECRENGVCVNYDVMKQVLKIILKDAVKGKEYMSTSAIMKLFREKYPTGNDVEFVRNLAFDLSMNKYGNLEDKVDQREGNDDDEVILIEKKTEVVTILDSDEEPGEILEIKNEAPNIINKLTESKLINEAFYDLTENEKLNEGIHEITNKTEKLNENVIDLTEGEKVNEPINELQEVAKIHEAINERKESEKINEAINDMSKSRKLNEVNNKLTENERFNKVFTELTKIGKINDLTETGALNEVINEMTENEKRNEVVSELTEMENISEAIMELTENEPNNEAINSIHDLIKIDTQVVKQEVQQQSNTVQCQDKTEEFSYRSSNGRESINVDSMVTKELHSTEIPLRENTKTREDSLKVTAITIVTSETELHSIAKAIENNKDKDSFMEKIKTETNPKFIDADLEKLISVANLNLNKLSASGANEKETPLVTSITIMTSASELCSLKHDGNENLTKEMDAIKIENNEDAYSEVVNYETQTEENKENEGSNGLGGTNENLVHTTNVELLGPRSEDKLLIDDEEETIESISKYLTSFCNDL